MLISKKERVNTVLSGNMPDRIPVSIWGHDFLREWSAEDLSNQTIESQLEFDYDFIKLNPRWSYISEVWGNTYKPPTKQVYPERVRIIVQRADDFSKIEPAAPSHAVFEEHLEAMELVLEGVGQKVDLLYTLFSPLAVAGTLCGGIYGPLLSLAEENPGALHHALAAITETLKAHVTSVIEKGASGLFFALLPWTSTEICSTKLYEEFGVPYDLEVLKAAEPASFNMLHVCGNHVELKRFYDYPVQVLNWDNFGEGNPSLKEAHLNSGKIVAGGIPHQTFQNMNFNELKAIAEKSLGGIKDRVMLTGGCGVLLPALAPEKRHLVREVAETIRF